MHILIADKFESSGIQGLQALGCEVSFEPDLKDQALVDAIAASGPEVLVVRSTKVPAEAIGPSLKLIIRAGAGYNTIDVKAASAKGVTVANCPGKNSIAVAELAMGLLLAVDRRIPENVAALRAGTWNKKEYSKARGLHGSTLGVLGAGNIAAEVIKRAAAFGMDIVLWSRRFDGEDRAMTADEAEGLGLATAAGQVSIAFAPTPGDVASRADALSVHLALGPETRGLVGKDVLDRMRPGAVFINTSRGELVDHDALSNAIRDRDLRVALDVFGQEPAAATGDFTDPIVQAPGVYGTHHIGASTNQAQEAVASEVVRIVKTFKETGTAPNAVN